MIDQYFILVLGTLVLSTLGLILLYIYYIFKNKHTDVPIVVGSPVTESIVPMNNVLPIQTEEILDNEEFDLTLSGLPMTESQWNIFCDIQEVVRE